MHHAPSIPRQNWYAMTMLDQNRSQSLLARKAGVPVAAVKNVALWGNHSATQFPDFYHATINGKSATDVISDSAWLEGDFINTVPPTTQSRNHWHPGCFECVSFTHKEAADAALDAPRALMTAAPRCCDYTQSKAASRHQSPLNSKTNLSVHMYANI